MNAPTSPSPNAPASTFPCPASWPSPPPTVLVTGASGNVGREVVGALALRGIPCVAAGTRPEKLNRLLGDGVKTTLLDFERPETYAGALQGVRGLFLLRPPAIARVKTTLNRLVDAALAVGVERIVFLSVIGADRHSWVPHYAVERHLEGCGVSHTLLRPGFFAQNLGDAYLRDIREDQRLFVPAGRGRVAFVDVRDVAELAARAFVEAALQGGAFTLTGPEAVTFEQVAEYLTQVTGRRHRYQPASLAGYAWHLRQRGLPWMQIAVQSLLHAGLAWGNAQMVDPTLEQLLGRPPRTLRHYVEDHRDLWEP